MAVDDDSISLSLLQECLAEGGYEHTTMISHPAEVLTSLTGTAIPYDCILLDIEMPGKDGIQLCAEIRQLPGYRNIPILMITKRNDHASVKKAFASGATDYITKPFEFFEVLTRIRVAERLVQERQAALDSYLAIRSDQDNDSANSDGSSITSPSVHEVAAIGSDQFLSLSTFQNYLERMVQQRGSKIDLIAVKVRQIGMIFENTSAAEFLDFLKEVAKAAVAGFGDDDMFIAHGGNGIFLCARQDGERYQSSAKESDLMKRIARYRLPAPITGKVSVEIVVGPPLPLSATSNLNFRRAVKAAIARMEKREGGIADLSMLEISG
ncbi:response regulator [Roseovarius spongiae]|nr:response regulator [Roseovarius spongiae]